MNLKPVVFVSAVTSELGKARQQVANALTALGYEPKWQDIAPTDAGDLRAVLRKWIDGADGVIQLVGRCYGYEPDKPDAVFGRCSYTQYEALYARQQGKPVWYFLAAPDFQNAVHGKEPTDYQQLQSHYLSSIKACSHLYHGFTTSAHLENLVLDCDDLATLREDWERHRKQVENDLAETKGKIDIYGVTLNRILAIAERDISSEDEIRQQIKYEYEQQRSALSAIELAEIEAAERAKYDADRQKWEETHLARAELDKASVDEFRQRIKEDVEKELAAKAAKERSEKEAAERTKREAEDIKIKKEIIRELMHTGRSNPYVPGERGHRLRGKYPRIPRGTFNGFHFWSEDPGEGRHIEHYYINLEGLLEILDKEEAASVLRANQDRDEKCFTEWAEKSRKTGNREGLASALYHLGYNAVEQGDRIKAQRYWSESGAIWEKIPNAQDIVGEIRTLLDSLNER